MRITVASACALLITTVAATSATPAWSKPGGDLASAGIEHAKAAGIILDPAAEPAMRSAPLGSCLNDPTQAKCGEVKRVVEDGQSVGDGSKVAFGAPVPATVSMARPVHRKHRRPRARAAAMKPCVVTAYNLSVANGYADAYGSLYCIQDVDWTELFVTLSELWVSDGKWHVEDTAEATGYGGKTIRAHASIHCREYHIRKFHDQAEGTRSRTAPSTRGRPTFTRISIASRKR